MNGIGVNLSSTFATRRYEVVWVRGAVQSGKLTRRGRDGWWTDRDFIATFALDVSNPPHRRTPSNACLSTTPHHSLAARRPARVTPSQRDAMVRWLNRLAEILLSAQSAAEKGRQAVQETMRAEVIWPLVKQFGAEAKRRGWVYSEANLPPLGAFLLASTGMLQRPASQALMRLSDVLMRLYPARALRRKPAPMALFLGNYVGKKRPFLVGSAYYPHRPRNLSIGAG